MAYSIRHAPARVMILGAPARVNTNFVINIILLDFYGYRNSGRPDALNMISNTKYGLASLYIELKVMAKVNIILVNNFKITN